MKSESQNNVELNINHLEQKMRQTNHWGVNWPSKHSV